jgi:hypothetical protein
MFERIERWYQLGLWTESMVLNAVSKGILTEAEATVILKVEGE